MSDCSGYTSDLEGGRLRTRAIVINGSGEAGKDSFVESAIRHLALLGYSASNHSSVDLVKEAAAVLGWDGAKNEKGRQFLSDLKDLSTSRYAGPMNYMSGLIKGLGHDFMFFHIREPQEIARFLEVNSGSLSLLVSRPGVQGFGNHADQNVAKHPYDFSIENAGTLADLDEKARVFVQELTGGILRAPRRVVLNRQKDCELEELRRLEQEIAYHGARSDIECFCASKAVSREPLLWWYDITTAGPVVEEGEWVTMAVRYLEMRGLLLRNPENPNQVRPLDA